MLRYPGHTSSAIESFRPIPSFPGALQSGYHNEPPPCSSNPLIEIGIEIGIGIEPVDENGDEIG